MANLTSGTFTITDADTVNRSAFSTKSLMPLDGDLRVWYGLYSGTPEELKINGMLIPEGKLLEHVMAHDGDLSLIAVTGTVVVHEVK